jgi:pimeloyl-ACP methyl ester carboxylesterase
MFGLIAFCLAALLYAFAVTQASAEWPHMAKSKDGSLISYEVFGSGEPTLVLVHCWSCDARYWREQIPYFSKKYRVIALDLAGHGHSEMSRRDYSMASFGEDVKAVVKSAAPGKVIFVGHSMGGSVIAEAARLMPERVIGLIGVDTLANVERHMTQKEYEKMTAAMYADFRTGCRQFVGGIIYPTTDPQLREWILSDMSAAPAAVALSSMKEMAGQYITGEAAGIFEQIRVPVISVNGDLWPVNYEANRRHMFSFDAIILKKADHFLMMTRPGEFNKALEKAIDTILKKRVD